MDGRPVDSKSTSHEDTVMNQKQHPFDEPSRAWALISRRDFLWMTVIRQTAGLHGVNF